ncbi:MAG: M1 family metallopeptidase, partial [Aquabacterium sp.]
RPRLALLRGRLRGAGTAAAVVAGLAWLGIGSWIFYNTNVLTRYVTRDDTEAMQADAERALLAFEKLPQPKVAAVLLDVQLNPGQARAVTRGHYTLVNRSGTPLTDVHVFLDPRTKMDALEIDGGATVEREWKRFNYRILKLAQPMQPGESRQLRFTTTLAEAGFVNGQPLTRIVDNGSFVDNTEISPFIGLSRDGLLSDRAKRRKHGLPPDLRPPTLEDESGRERSSFRADGDWVTAEIRVTTDADQTPIAPGATISDTVTGQRRTVVFRPETPIDHFFSIQSGRYAVKRDVWKGPKGDVALSVYHHPDHAYNVDRMLAAKKLSLAVFSEVFSPYQFNQARILEFPSYASFAQSFANTIPYSEAIGFIHRWSDPEKIDMVTYVTAHEIGHQWWGHQLVPSHQQGSTMLVESFAQYSALLVMERLYGPEQIRRFLKYELDRYLRNRGGEVVEELPLARVENQPYIHYNKGSLAMWWIKEMAGEVAVNRAMARFLQQYAYKAAPYPNTLDFLKLLREEAGPAHDALITDLFERITLLDLKAKSATSRRLPDGRWALTLDVEARKLYADGKGRETEAPLDEMMEIGAFIDEPGTREFKAASVLLLERRRITGGVQRITVTLNREPRWAGLDPYNKRIDRQSSDNLVAVEAAPR